MMMMTVVVDFTWWTHTTIGLINVTSGKGQNAVQLCNDDNYEVMIRLGVDMVMMMMTVVVHFT